MTVAASRESAEAVASAEPHRPRLRAYARSILHDADAAEDAVQDALCRLLDASNIPAEPAALRAWLFTAVRNRCIDVLRKEKRMTALAELDASVPAPPASNPAQRIEAADDARHALAALDALPTLQRDALRLRFSGGLSYKQIAAAMDKSVSHVGVLIHEGLATLRQQLNPNAS